MGAGAELDASVIVVGAGGHARVCIEALQDCSLHVVDCVSADGVGLEGLPCPVLGRDSDLVAIAAAHHATKVFVAVGDNAARERLQTQAAAAGLVPVNAISRFSMISPSAELGVGIYIGAGAVVCAAAVVGDGAILNTGATLDHDGRVGPFAHVAVGVTTGGNVHIGRRALVGLGSTVLPGCSVGDDAVVGGGAVVVRDVAAGLTVVGEPARASGRHR